jgi:ribosomal 50S subunit-associated protein YjgA (DUF615 family)
MNRPQLEHILRAAAAITGAQRFIVIGSQAGRPKDLQFIADLLRHQMADADTLRQRLALVPLDAPLRQACEARLAQIVKRNP